MDFVILTEIRLVETIARGAGIRNVAKLRRKYGKGNWLKRKGVAEVRLENGERGLAEIHWHEANGIGKRDFKIKHFLD